VISVGNLTVGGTSKTPTVAWLSDLARSAAGDRRARAVTAARPGRR
jgi:tetraacyldisaccharide-1-P 4'-kinase